jgi:hypothetical protein
MKANDEWRSVLERPSEVVDYTRVWRVVISALEELLGQDATRALCFHISKRTGMAIDKLVLDKPELFRETAILLVDSSIDKVLDKVGARLLQEFGIKQDQHSFLAVVDRLKNRA